MVEAVEEYMGKRHYGWMRDVITANKRLLLRPHGSGGRVERWRGLNTWRDMMYWQIAGSVSGKAFFPTRAQAAQAIYRE